MLSKPISSQYLLDISREYAIYVCKNRGIPSVQDGLKHVQRMALWVLHNRPEKIKTFALSGLLGYSKLHVHGETSANDAIGRLAAPFCNNIPLIEGLGQFGNRIAPVEGIGAPRYTDVKRAKSAESFLYTDIDLVPLIDNFDGSNKEPLHFLPLVPTVLLNGVSGVAVGWSTEILPRSLKTLVEATKNALLDKPIKNIEPFYSKYDIEVRPVGPNKWEFIGKVEFVDTSTLKITELPPGMGIERFRKKLISMEDRDEIVSFTDRSTSKIDITIKMKRGSLKDWTHEQAVKFFKLKVKKTERIVVIDWEGHAIRTYSDPEVLIRDFAQWRLGWYKTRFEKLLADRKYELTFWLAMLTLFNEKFPSQLGKFDTKQDMEASIRNITSEWNLDLDGRQMDRIMNLQTYRWTNTFHEEICETINSLETEIASYEETLSSPEKLKGVYISELDQINHKKL